ncbi:Nucleoid occlusion protein [subsurface metagenome]
MELKQIPIDQFDVSVNAQRLDFEVDALDELRASIRRLGIVTPLVVVRHGDRFEILAGHRRHRAAVLEGFKTVPAIVRDEDKDKDKEVVFADNYFRADLSPVELAAAIKDCVASKALTIEDLAKGFHRSENWVCHQMDIMSWPPDVLEVIHNGNLSVSAASNLAMVRDDAYRDFLLRQAVENGATARATAAWLQAYRSSAPPQEAITREPVAPGAHATPAVPQAPCICCGDVFRTDELSHVPVCVGCIRAIRNIGSGS